MTTRALALMVLVCLSAPAWAQRAEIDRVNAQWIESFNKGDFAAVASLYTDDAAVMPPGSPIVRGRAAIAALWKGLAGQISEPKLTTLEVKKLGPKAAREIGTVSMKTREPAPKELTAKYVVLWERVRGQWKLAVDIWNDGK